jgi:hypothetical protein
MEFGIFNLMGSRDSEKPTAEVFAEVTEQTRLADGNRRPLGRQLLDALNSLAAQGTIRARLGARS